MDVTESQMQCINHQHKWQYPCGRAALDSSEDPAVLMVLEQEGPEEKEQPRSAAAKERRQAQHLSTEAQRLREANRQLKCDLEVVQTRMDHMPRRHQRELRRMKWSCQREVQELAELLEAPRRGHLMQTKGQACPHPLCTPPPASPTGTMEWSPGGGWPQNVPDWTRNCHKLFLCGARGVSCFGSDLRVPRKRSVRRTGSVWQVKYSVEVPCGTSTTVGGPFLWTLDSVTSGCRGTRLPRH